MIKLELLPETTLQLQVAERVIKTGLPEVKGKYITENGTYFATKEGVYGFDPVTVEVDMTAAREEGYGEGYATGFHQGLAEGFQQGGQKTRYMQNIQGTFRNTVFPTGYVLDLTVLDSSATGGDILHFANGATGLKKIKLSFINQGTAVSANYAFAGPGANAEDTLEEVDISGMGCTFKSFAGTFQNRKALKKVVGAIDLTGCINCNAPFANSFSLEEIAFRQLTIRRSMQLNHAPNLTETAAQSVIDGLADLTGETAQTLNFHKDVGAKLTNEQKAAITAKNWTLVY